jgi:hypothetical protein
MINNIVLFWCLFFLQYILDRFTTKCDTIKGEIYLFIHHIMSVYILFGGFLFNPIYHLIFLIIILLHWITNNNKCLLTELTNKYCGLNKNRKFKDFLYYITKNRNILYILFFIYIIYDIYKI